MDSISRYAMLNNIADFIQITKATRSKLDIEDKKLICEKLDKIEECNESWCDSCGVRKELGYLCSELVDEVKGSEVNG